MMTRFDPFTELNRLHDELFAPRTASRAQPFKPAVDIVESDEAFELHAELPGLAAEDFTLDVEKNLLTLRGERKGETLEEGRGFRRVERFHGTFSRSFQLPETVDAEAIEASLEAGVLTVRLPKRQAPGARKVDVKVN